MTFRCRSETSTISQLRPSFSSSKKLVSNIDPREKISPSTPDGPISMVPSSNARIGLVSDVKSFKSSDTLKLRVNRIHNYSDHLGRIWGNRLGVIGLLYTGLESGMVSLRDANDVWNHVAVGLMTGAMY
ncbi:hypothetical protein UlMin_024697 [Ulmus minor]